MTENGDGEGGVGEVMKRVAVYLVPWNTSMYERGGDRLASGRLGGCLFVCLLDDGLERWLRSTAQHSTAQHSTAQHSTKGQAGRACHGLSTIAWVIVMEMEIWAT